MSPATPLRIALVEDDPGIRAGLCAVLDAAEGFVCAGVFGSVEEMLARFDGAADVMLMDIHLPLLSGVEGVPLLKGRHPDLPVVMLTVYDDAERIFAALKAGAIRHMMRDLPRRPAALPVRMVELPIVEAGHGRSQLFGQPGELHDPPLPHRGRHLGLDVQRSDRVANGVEIGGGHRWASRAWCRQTTPDGRVVPSTVVSPIRSRMPWYSGRPAPSSTGLTRLQ